MAGPGSEEEKEWVFAPESDNVVILVPYQVKLKARREQRVLPKSNESVRRAFLPELHHSSLRHREASAPPPSSWLESRSATGVDILLVGLVMGPKRRRIEVERNWFSVSANGKNVPARSLATQSLSRGFCMRGRGSS